MTIKPGTESELHDRLARFVQDTTPHPEPTIRYIDKVSEGRRHVSLVPKAERRTADRRQVDRRSK